MRLIDLFLALPWLFLLLTVRATLPLNVSPAASITITFALLSLLGWAGPARVIRSGAQSLRQAEFILQARASGCPGPRLLFVHVLPNLLLVDDQYSETIRYLTGGVLIRVNRRTQELEPELAASWKIQQNGRGIVFKLRRGLLFSDGTPFSANDVAYTMRALLDPNLHS